jgi:hypothetical protein
MGGHDSMNRERINGIVIAVEHHAFVAICHESPHHISPHSSEADHSNLHKRRSIVGVSMRLT